MNLVGAADGGGTRFRKAERAHLALAHQLGHGADGVLDRYVRVDAVLVVEIDDICAEPLERGFRYRLRMLRPAVDAPDRLDARHAGLDAEAELGGDDHLVTHRAERLADELFVLEGTIDFGRVEEGDAEIDGALQRADRFRFVRSAIGETHAHASKADGGDGKLTSEFAGLHVVSFMAAMRRS